MIIIMNSYDHNRLIYDISNRVIPCILRMIDSSVLLIHPNW